VMVQKYVSHISGPLLDRIDLHIEVGPVRYDDLAAPSGGEPSANIRARVLEARRIQGERFQHVPKIHVNADMGTRELRKYCRISPDGEKLLRTAMETMGLSARGYDRVLKVSRTIADLNRSLEIKPEHLAEAIQYRSLDRENLF